jgi:hypothetical protein
VNRFASLLIFAGAIVALETGSALPGPNRPERREMSPVPHSSALERAVVDTAPPDADPLAAAMLRLNGDIFWAPAAASSNMITRFGDEARSVFGPIPYADCASDDARVIPLEVDGNIVDLRPNPDKPGHPLEFEHRDAAGDTVKWTANIPKCDKPSLAGKLTYCGPNSRLNRVVNGSVEWLFLCRKSTDSLEVESAPYWLRSNTEFALLGTIGFNSLTGEQVFFDGRKDRKQFDWSQPFVPPGGSSYSDAAGRAAAEDLYDPTFQVQCSSCHDNKNAYVINPHISVARVGYFSGEDDERAAAFSLGDYLPSTPRDEEAPLRVIGSGYTERYRVEIDRARTVRDPSGNCTTCHTLTTQLTGQRFAADAVAREPWIARPTWIQSVGLKFERRRFAAVDAHRTDWARRSGAGKIHPWMVPGTGNDVSGQSAPISTEDWQALSNCLWRAGGGECGYRPLYTQCAAPGAGPKGDGHAPERLSAVVPPLPSGQDAGERILRISWRYLNGYGNIPQRDDVRFDLVVKETPLPADAGAPAASDYPRAAEASDQAEGPVARFSTSGSTTIIRDASYRGHERFTDPIASTEPSEYRLDIPAKCNRRYLVRLLPKRFCFDQTEIQYGVDDHLTYADLSCE